MRPIFNLARRIGMEILCLTRETLDYKRNVRLFDGIDNFLRWQPESLARSSELTLPVTDRKRAAGIFMVFPSPLSTQNCLSHSSVKPAPANGPTRSAADKCVEYSGPKFLARL